MTTRADGPFASVLDAGAGMGVSTRVFADRAQRTVALDISRKMLREL
jgi:cyclopropane-fatty-acyl-phospholipid synthase